MLKLVKKSKILIIFWVLFYFLLFGFLLRNSFAYLDPDLGWHLRVGEEIARNHVLPHLNIYNYTFTGRWVDHEWLINLISFIIYDNIGYLGLNIFFAAIIIFSLIFLNFFLRRILNKTSEWLIAILQFFGLIACLPHFGVRMQEFGFLFLLLELFIIAEFNDKKKTKILFWLWPLFYLWANIHGSFVLGLGILFIWPAIKLIEQKLSISRWRQYFLDNKIIEISDVRAFFVFCLGAFLITLITPYGLELYSFLGGYGNTFYLGAIKEWIPQFRFPFDYWQLSYLALIILTLGLYIYQLAGKKKGSIDIWQISLAVIFLSLSFKSRRHFPLLFIATMPLLVKSWYLLLDLDNIKLFFFRQKLKYLLLICLGLAGLAQYIKVETTANPFNSFCSKYPCQAAEFLRTDPRLKDLNILNEYDWGGYLIWLQPERKLFIDGRIPQAEYAGHTFLEEYLEFFQPAADYSSKLAQYNIKVVLLRTEDLKLKAENWEKLLFLIKDKDLIYPNYLRHYLDNSADWTKIYIDPLASIYLKLN